MGENFVSSVAEFAKLTESTEFTESIYRICQVGDNFLYGKHRKKSEQQQKNTKDSTFDYDFNLTCEMEHELGFAWESKGWWVAVGRRRAGWLTLALI